MRKTSDRHAIDSIGGPVVGQNPRISGATTWNRRRNTGFGAPRIATSSGNRGQRHQQAALTLFEQEDLDPLGKWCVRWHRFSALFPKIWSGTAKSTIRMSSNRCRNPQALRGPTKPVCLRELQLLKRRGLGHRGCYRNITPRKSLSRQDGEWHAFLAAVVAVAFGWGAWFPPPKTASRAPRRSGRLRRRTLHGDYDRSVELGSVLFEKNADELRRVQR